MISLSFQSWLRSLCLVAIFCKHTITADYLYQGNLYNPATYNDSNTVCYYPVEATPEMACPTKTNISQAGVMSFNLDNPAEQPPEVFASVALRQFDNIDQVLLSFTVRVSVFLAWNDTRSYAQIQRATAEARRTGKCQKYCTKATLSGGVGDCCDGIWLPTMSFMGAQARTFAEENYIISAQGPDYPIIDGYDNRNTTFYLFSATTTVHQAFDFSAFPFDKHALLLKILCQDCRFVRDPFGSDPAYFSTYRFTSKLDSQGEEVDGQDIPASSGWQLNSVDLALVNITSDTSIDRPSLRGSKAATAADASADNYGLIFILKVQRVTRLYYALQTIMPPIILVLIGFSTFTVAQEKFAERIRLLITVLFPLIVVQFTISNLLPKTYTILSPQLLAFLSLLELAILIVICCTTHHILNRKEHFVWKAGILKRKRYSELRAFLLEGMEDGKKGKGEGDDTGDEEDPELVKRQSAISNGAYSMPEPTQTGKDAASEKKSADAKAKAEHDAFVRQVAQRTQRGPRWLREARLWFTSLALSDAAGARDRVALVFESWALFLAFILYVAAVLGIFLAVNAQGRNNDQL